MSFAYHKILMFLISLVGGIQALKISSGKLNDASPVKIADLSENKGIFF